jgi:NitT/TauT family transport system ATP-binding protein
MAARMTEVSRKTPVRFTPRSDVPELVELKHIRHSFNREGNPLPVIEDVNLVLGAGEFVSVVGPSGCGKSTLLRMISGLLKPTGGDVFVRGAKVDKIRTDVGYMFQTDPLLP